MPTPRPGPVIDARVIKADLASVVADCLDDVASGWKLSRGPMPQLAPTGRPRAGEYADYAQADIDRVTGDDAIAALEEQLAATLALLAPLDDGAVAGLTYAPGKWTVKEVVGHLVDDERIFAYRLLRVARGDLTPLPGFDEKLYAANSGAEDRPLADLVEEYTTVREATLSLLRGLPSTAWTRRATVNGYAATPRGLAFHIAGHELRHVTALREKYLVLLTARAFR